MDSIILVQSTIRQFLALVLCRQLQSAIFIQKHVRGFLQRQKFKPILIEKLLKEQEEDYLDQILTVERALGSDPVYERRNLDMPFQIKTRRPLQSIVFDFDVYILAATEIQRVFRGWKARRSMLGGFHKLRRKICKIQKLYRSWACNRGGQISAALALITKQTNILVKTFGSYQQLRSLVLSKDLQGMHSHFLRDCDSKLIDVGLYSNTQEQFLLKNECAKVKKQIQNNRAKFNEEIENTQKRHKELIAHCTKGIKAFKQHIEDSQRNNMEYLTDIVKGIVEKKSED